MPIGGYICEEQSHKFGTNRKPVELLIEGRLCKIRSVMLEISAECTILLILSFSISALFQYFILANPTFGLCVEIAFVTVLQ